MEAGEQSPSEELRTRLHEAEAVLHAIVHHEVDALVVQGTKGEQVYTLKGAEQPYRVIVESISEGAATLGADGCIYYCNRAFADMLRQPLHRVIGATLADYIAPADLARYGELAGLGLSTPSKREVRVVAADGTVLPVLLACSPLALDEVAGICVVATDLSEQKRQAEHLLQARLRLQQEIADRESEERFRSTFEQAAVGIAHVSLDGRYLRVNQRLCDITGYTREQLLALQYLDITLPEYHDRDSERTGRMLRGEVDGARVEKRYRRADGSAVWVQVTVSLARNVETQEPTYFISVIEDIDERKANEERLRLLAELGEVLMQPGISAGRLQPVPDLLTPRLGDWCVICSANWSSGQATEGPGFVVAAHADPELAADLGRIVCEMYLNTPSGLPAMAPATLQRTASLLIADAAATPWADERGLLPLRRFGLTSLIGVPLQTGEEAFGVLLLARAAGQYDEAALRFAEVIAQRLALTLENARLYGAAREAEAGLRRLNETLELRVQERTAELERSNRELDRFAYIASHDLRAPLRAIDNLAKWIEVDALPVLPAETQEHLHKLRNRVTRMEQLLEDLLAYSRVGRQQHAVEPVDVDALVRNVYELMAPPPAFRLVIPAPLPRIETQRVPLETVLRNLIGNAIKHHNRTDGMVAVSVVNGEEWLEFAIADDGPGIAPQYHQRIFEIFQTLQPRDRVEGSGMGLAIVKKTVESMGGAVSMESDVGQGAIFRFTWPKQMSRL